MKRSIFTIALLTLLGVSVFSGIASAYWIWTPETKKFTNPKYAVKDSPKEQFDWAMSFYTARDFQRAATEFEKLAKQYEFSEYASKAQYYVGLCYENMNKYYLAYQNYQKAIDNFPHIANTEEILAREFAIGNLYLSKPGPKVLGTDIMAPLDRAVEIFKKVVENAPYGKFSEEAQFKLGEALKKSERYEEAVQAFHKLVEDYPKSKFATQAMYEESDCAYKASLKPAYDAAATDNAIKTFEKFTQKNKDSDLAKNADATMKRLKDNVSEKSFRAAEFYEAQGKTQAAIIYYQDVIDSYPDSVFVDKAKAKIETLKSKGTKKAVSGPIIDLSKKKSDKVVKEKKPWRPFSFKSKNIEQEKPEAVAEQPVKKRSWNPLKLWGSKKAKPQVEAQEISQTAPVKEAPKKRPWSLFDFGKKREPVVKEIPVKKAWKPFSFDTKKKEEPKEVVEVPAAAEAPVDDIKEEPAVEAQTEVETPAVTYEPQVVQTLKSDIPAQEAPVVVETQKQEVAPVQTQEPIKKKAWKPLSFDTKKKEETAPAQAQEPMKKKSWKPLNFDKKRDPTAKKPINKGWQPLYFGTNDGPMR